MGFTQCKPRLTASEGNVHHVKGRVSAHAQYEFKSCADFMSACHAHIMRSHNLRCMTSTCAYHAHITWSRNSCALMIESYATRFFLAVTVENPVIEVKGYVSSHLAHRFIKNIPL